MNTAKEVSQYCCCTRTSYEYVQYIHELCTRLTNAYMLRIDGFRQEADNDAQHGHDDEQDDTEMQVVNFADDVRLVGVLAARCL